MEVDRIGVAKKYRLRVNCRPLVDALTLGMRRQMKRLCTTIGIIASAAMFPALEVNAVPLRVVAMADAPFTGSNTSFEGFNLISLNNSGQVAFTPMRFPNREGRPQFLGVWSEGRGDSAEMIHGPAFGFWDLVLNDVGRASFTNGSGQMQSSTAADLQMVAGYGKPAPGIDPASTFSDFFNYTGSVFNDRGEVAFVKTAG